MFNRKVTTTTPTEEILKPFTIPVREIANNIRLDTPTLNIDHLEQLYAITQRDDVLGKINLHKLMGLRFTHVVNSRDIIKNFKYHASISNADEKIAINTVAQSIGYGRFSQIVYVGDIPSFVINNINTIPQNIREITIHSNEKLPVEFIPSAYHDPVVIAWSKYPAFRISQSGADISCNNVDGVILGIWNEEGREI